MGAWRYCEHCGEGQDRISIEEIESNTWDATCKVFCEHCEKPRSDDTPEERIDIVIRAYGELKRRIEAIEAKL